MGTVTDNDARTPLRLVGWGLIASGIVYAGVFFGVGGEWAGPTSLRKPILFGLSTGVTALSMAWVAGGLRARAGDAWLYGCVAIALLLEVALIDLQQGRGVPSHFNHQQPFDHAVSLAMNGLIFYATAAIALMTARTFQTTSFAPDDLEAVRWGMGLLLLGCLIGFGISWLGDLQAAKGLAPETYGQAGVLKFPHGLPLHAIQLLFVAVRGLRGARVPVTARRRAVRALGLSVLLFCGYGVVQVGAGAPRFPPTGWGWAFVAASGLAFCLAGFTVVRAVR